MSKHRKKTVDLFSDISPPRLTAKPPQTKPKAGDITVLDKSEKAPKDSNVVTKVQPPLTFSTGEQANATGVKDNLEKADIGASNVKSRQVPTGFAPARAPPSTGGQGDDLQDTLKLIATSLHNLNDNVRTNSETLQKFTQNFDEDYEDLPEEYDNFDLEPVPQADRPCARTHEMSSDEGASVKRPAPTSDSSGPKKSLKQSFMDDMNEATGQVDQKGPPIDSTIASSLDKLMRVKTEDTDEERKNTFPPENCGGLSPIRVNNEVWSRISSAAKHKDLKLQSVGNFLVAGTTHLAYLVDKLTDCWDEKKESLSQTALQEILQHGKKAFKLLGGANYELQMRRREYLKSEMNISHTHLCSPSVPFTTELFGDDVTKTITEITSQNRVANRALKETQSVRARPRGRGRGRPWRARGRGYYGRGSYGTYGGYGPSSAFGSYAAAQAAREAFLHEPKPKTQPKPKKDN